MEGYYFDHALLISCIDGLGRFNERLGVYEKEMDTLSAPFPRCPTRAARAPGIRATSRSATCRLSERH